MRLIALLIFSQLHSAASGRLPPLAPALYVFGDSLFDGGNNNFLPTIAKADFLPYGMNFIKGVTGRFTNGRTLPDLIAEYLRLPYPPAFLSIRASTPTTGLNYASGSCGILSETGSALGKCLNVEEQIDLFEGTVKLELRKHFKSRSEIEKYLSESIFVISAGSNDYLNNYLVPSIFDSSKRFTPPQFANFLLHKLSLTLERLYSLGGRKIVVFEIGPIGCIPSIARKHRKGEMDGKCVEESNHLVSYFNTKLGALLHNLTSTFPTSRFVYGHANWLGYDAILHPSKYGIMDTSNPCCTTWANGTSACIPWAAPCPNPNTHYFFDGFHLTENLYSVIASHCINHKSVCDPTINELLIM